MQVYQILCEFYELLPTSNIRKILFSLNFLLLYLYSYSSFTFYHAGKSSYWLTLVKPCNICGNNSHESESEGGVGMQQANLNISTDSGEVV